MLYEVITNPMDYNGMKLVGAGAKPISGDTGLDAIQQLAAQNEFAAVDPAKRGSYQTISIQDRITSYNVCYTKLLRISCRL